MSEQQTCGKGLAARAWLPAKLAELAAGMAEILAFHQKSLDLGDPNGVEENRVYMGLEERYRTAASLLTVTAEAMTGSRDLPMAAHDTRVLASEENASIFARFVKIEEELAELLRRSIEMDRRMSSQMHEAAFTKTGD